MSGYATLKASGENEADVNLKKRTRVTTTSYPCGKNKEGERVKGRSGGACGVWKGGAKGIGRKKAVLL